MTITATPLTAILTKSDSHLGKLVAKATQLNKLNELFHNILTSDLAQHCQVANLTADTLTLIVENSAWTTRLRFNIPEIIKTLKVQPEFARIKKITYKIRT